MTDKESLGIGNAAKLREAVQSILDLAYEVAAETEEPRCKMPNDWLIETCKAALAAPTRNCDVGTADQQALRFRDDWERANDERAPQVGLHLASQFARWAQIPYNESEAKSAPRPATEQEIEEGKAKWCEVCVIDCPDKGKDLLCICEKTLNGSEATDGK